MYKQIIAGVAGLLVGAAAGYFVTKKITEKNKPETDPEYTQEEYDAMKKLYEDRIAKLQNHISKMKEEANKKVKKVINEQTIKRERYAPLNVFVNPPISSDIDRIKAQLNDETQTGNSYADNIEEDLEEGNPMGMELVGPPEDRDSEIIDDSLPEDYEDGFYELSSLSYYADNVWVDEDDIILVDDEIRQMTGYQNLDDIKCKMGIEQSVTIRNFRKEHDYEIILLDNEFFGG